MKGEQGAPGMPPQGGGQGSRPETEAPSLSSYCRIGNQVSVNCRY